MKIKKKCFHLQSVLPMFADIHLDMVKTITSLYQQHENCGITCGLKCWERSLSQWRFSDSHYLDQFFNRRDENSINCQRCESLALKYLFGYFWRNKQTMMDVDIKEHHLHLVAHTHRLLVRHIDFTQQWWALCLKSNNLKRELFCQEVFRKPDTTFNAAHTNKTNK